MEKIRKIGRLVVPLAMIGIFALPLLVLAQGLPDPTSPVGGEAIDLNEIQDLIERVARFLIVVGVVIAVIYIIWGGLAYMYAGGEEDAKTAKARIKNGIIGAAIVLGVGVILQTLAGLVSRSFFS